MIDQTKQRIEVGRLDKLLNKRTVIAQRLQQLLQVLFREKQQRLVSQHRDVVVEDDIGEQIRFRRKPRAEALDELPVFLHVFALDHRDQLVLGNKLLFVAQKIPVILLLRAHKVIPVGVEFEPRDGVNNAGKEKQKLRIKKQPRIAIDGIRQPAQHTNGK